MYYSMNTEEVVRNFSSSLTDGLKSSEAKARLEKYGKNKLEARKKTSIVSMFFSQFSELLVIILIFASIISAFLGELLDAGIIFAVIIINAIVGVLQEYRAEKALEALKNMMAPQATVIRDRDEKIISVEELVPGDIIILEEGSKVPADSRILESSVLKVDESALTGESVPRMKSEKIISGKDVALADRHNMLFMGTTTTSGRCKAIVVETGMKTEFGRIAGLTSEIKDEKSPLQKELGHVAKIITQITFVICSFVFIMGMISGKEFGEMLIFAISLGVAAVPEGLPATMTIALALGVQIMAKKKAIVRKLSSVETLGSTTVICTDKTGTLTKNQMTVKKIYCSGQMIDVEGEGYDPKGDFFANGKAFEEDELFGILRTGLLCNNAVLRNENGFWKIIGDPTEGALVVCSEKAGMKQETELENYKRIYEFPFSSEKMYMITVHSRLRDKKVFAYMKGSPEAVLSRCSHIEINGKVRKLTSKDKLNIKKADEQLASNALRILAFAYKPLNNKEAKIPEKTKQSGFILQGLQGMIDPPRAEVAEAVSRCKVAGIRVFVITGDQGITAKAIAKQIGIAEDSTKVITGPELDKLKDEDLAKELDKQIIFARMTAENKMRIVSLLISSNKEIVAVTGDGVNDAPALKKADIGIAMGITGTDVSKEAAKIVLKDDNFATIVNAVEEGRTILDNIKTFMKYIFIGNGACILAIFISMAAGIPAPLTALQIIWFNLVTETIPSLGLTMEPPKKNIMSRKPRNAHERIITKNDFAYIIANAVIIAAGVLLVYIISLQTQGWNFGDVASDDSLMFARTMAFTTLVFFQFFNAFTVKSSHTSVFFDELFNNKWLWLAIIISIALQIFVIHTPSINHSFGNTHLKLYDWILITCVSTAGLLLNEVFKLIRKLFGNREF